jgi:hypothetical protein
LAKDDVTLYTEAVVLVLDVKVGPFVDAVNVPDVPAVAMMLYVFLYDDAM